VRCCRLFLEQQAAGGHHGQVQQAGVQPEAAAADDALQWAQHSSVQDAAAAADA
jgi:hypothetical protein